MYGEYAFRRYGHGELGSNGDRRPFAELPGAVFLQIERNRRDVYQPNWFRTK